MKAPSGMAVVLYLKGLAQYNILGMFIIFGENAFLSVVFRFLLIIFFFSLLRILNNSVKEPYFYLNDFFIYCNLIN